MTDLSQGRVAGDLARVNKIFPKNDSPAMQGCSQHSPASVNLELGNYIETQDSRDYNGLEVRQLMVCVPPYCAGQEKHRMEEPRWKN
jgi:hypothetical protein